MRIGTARNTSIWVARVLLALTLVVAIGTHARPVSAGAQLDSKSDELTRKPKTKVSPVYPDVARRMSITGTVRLVVVVAPNGAVKSAKPLGGHPVLVNAAMDAMKQWRFEPASAESSGVVEFKFQPQE